MPQGFLQSSGNDYPYSFYVSGGDDDYQFTEALSDELVAADPLPPWLVGGAAVEYTLNNELEVIALSVIGREGEVTHADKQKVVVCPNVGSSTFEQHWKKFPENSTLREQRKALEEGKKVCFGASGNTLLWVALKDEPWERTYALQGAPAAIRCLSAEQFDKLKAPLGAKTGCTQSISLVCPNCNGRTGFESFDAMGDPVCGKCTWRAPPKQEYEKRTYPYAELFDEENRTISFRVFKWVCPHDPCEEKNPLSSVGTNEENPTCSKCKKSRTDPFYSTSTYWVCPRTCEEENRFYDVKTSKENLTCSKCKKSRPDPFYYTSKFSKEGYCLTYKALPALLTMVSAEDIEELSKTRGGGSYSAKDIMNIADADFEDAKGKYKKSNPEGEEGKKEKSFHSCPHCESHKKDDGKGKGCGHESLASLAPLSFSTWYYLNEQVTQDGKTSASSRAKRRLEELSTLLEKLPRCSCEPDKLKALPRSPFNVFRRVEKDVDIDPDKAYWNAKGVEAAKNRLAYLKNSAPRTFEPLLVKDWTMQCHVTPRSAGGCFTSGQNVIPIREFCPTCQCLDKLFTRWQGENAAYPSLDAYVTRFVATKEVLEKRCVTERYINSYLKVREENEEELQGWARKVDEFLKSK